MGGDDRTWAPEAPQGDGDLPQCITDVEGIATAAEDILAMAKSKNIDMSKAIADVQTIVADVK